MNSNFKHQQAAHCESGVTRNLLQNIGISAITEPLAFGIGSGLFFVYVPLLKINGGPAIAFRSMPGIIFKQTCKSLDITVHRKKFSSKQKAQQFLDARLAEGHAVGCQVGVYYLPYFPKEYRFHFNAHNLVVFDKQGDNYLVSDPIMDGVNSMTSYQLERVRFAKGALAPNGQVYYAEKQHDISNEQMKHAIQNGIKKNIFNMLSIPGPIAGVKGIGYLGKKIKNWKTKFGDKKAGLYLAQLVRMQEEIGTGGGGFRYIYGAFLQEAYAYYQADELIEISATFTKSGDLWRNSAIQAAGIYKGRLGSQADYNAMGDYLLEIAGIEQKAFEDLKKIKWH